MINFHIKFEFTEQIRPKLYSYDRSFLSPKTHATWKASFGPIGEKISQSTNSTSSAFLCLDILLA